MLRCHSISENYKSSKPMHRHNKELPTISQMQNEGDDQYLQRINRITRESIEESKFEAKYGVEVIRNKKTGEIVLKKKPQDELELRVKSLLKPNGKRKQGVVIDAATKKKLVKDMMQKKKNEKEKANKGGVEEFKKDHVAFGEVAHAPPTLVTPRRAKKAETVYRV